MDDVQGGTVLRAETEKDAMYASDDDGHSANGVGPQTSETGWRAEQQLIRLVTRTQGRRQRLSLLHARLAAASADDEAAWAAVDQEQALTDPEDRRFGSLPAAFAIAIVV